MPKLTKHHTARVIAITEPLPEIAEEIGCDDAEALTAYITRVSNPSNQGSSKVGSLIRYCCKHGHWSILEHVYMTMEILTTRDISAQICRHHSFRFQEFSQRYSTTDSFDTPYENPQLRLQDKKNRQKSKPIKRFVLFWMMVSLLLSGWLKVTYTLYQILLELGVAKESARRILPMSSTTKIYMTGNIRSWLFYIKSRNTRDGKAQKEHQWVADECEEFFSKYFPTVYKATFLNDETPA